MNGQTLAHVRRILTGHSDRALSHAVNDPGLEYKLEVPVEAVRGVDSDHVFDLAGLMFYTDFEHEVAGFYGLAARCFEAAIAHADAIDADNARVAVLLYGAHWRLGGGGESGAGH